MTIFSLNQLLSLAEPLLVGLTLFGLYRVRENRRFPAFTGYLVLRLISTAVLNALLYAHGWLGIERHAAYAAYYYCYFASYLAGACLIFLVMRELFQQLMSPLPGLHRLGTAAFRWIGIISLVFAAASLVFPFSGNRSLFVSLPSEVMRCVSLLELCLLALLAFSVRTLGLPLRSRVFGIGFGFGLFACMDFVSSAIAFRHPSLSSTANLIAQAGMTVGLLLWAAYFLLPEPERRVVTMPATSTLLKWNEVAVALGHPAAQVALVQSTDFFLEDVEKVVDRIFARNSI